MSWKLLKEVGPMYQEQVTWRRCYNEMLERIRYISHVTWISCYNILGMSSKLLQEDVTTYQERLASDLTKMSERLRYISHVACERWAAFASNKFVINCDCSARTCTNLLTQFVGSSNFDVPV